MIKISVFIQGRGGSGSSMFVQSLRGDPFRVSFILTTGIHFFGQSSRIVNIHTIVR